MDWNTGVYLGVFDLPLLLFVHLALFCLKSAQITPNWSRDLINTLKQNINQINTKSHQKVHNYGQNKPSVDKEIYI